MFFIVSASIGIGAYKVFERTLSEEKLIFVRDEKESKSKTAATLQPNGVLCIDLPVFYKQENPKPESPVKK